MSKHRILIAWQVIISMLFVNCNNGISTLGVKLERPINIILLIGDGMGLAQISAAAMVNGGLSLDLFTHIGLVKTSSSDDYITDSAAGASAYSTGTKTYNGAIGVGPDSAKLQTLLELAEMHGLSSGLIATCSITHATPAAFYAHRVDREMHREIASDLYGKSIDFLAGSGKPYFDMGKLLAEGYTVVTGKNQDPKGPMEKCFWFYNDSIDAPKSAERGNWLQRATKLGIEQLSANKKGFFLMVEGSQIDWGGHDNDFDYVVSELLDFDKAVRSALAFARKDGNTLVIVTADHETGGLSLNAGDLKKCSIQASFASTHHSGVMVPVYAFGPGAELFTGTMENTDIHRHMKKLFGF